MQNPNQPTNVSAFKQWPFLRRAKKSWPLYPWLSERISKLVQTSKKSVLPPKFGVSSNLCETQRDSRSLVTNSFLRICLHRLPRRASRRTEGVFSLLCPLKSCSMDAKKIIYYAISFYWVWFMNMRNWTPMSQKWGHSNTKRTRLCTISHTKSHAYFPHL